MIQLDHILPELFALITRRKREKVDITWSSKSWTHNIFRVWELLFWRRDDVRCEMLSSHYHDEDGWHTVYSPQTFEASCALLETVIRERLQKLATVRVYVPMLQPVAGFPIPASPYLFAIAFDQLTSNTASPTSFSATTSGSNRVAVLFVTSGANDATATYNSVSLTKQGAAVVPVALDVLTCFTLLAPATGSNTVAIGGTITTGAQFGSYTGVGAVSGYNSDTSGDPTTATYTVGVANSVVVSSGYGRNGPHALVASTGVANDRYGATTSSISSYGDSGAVSSNTAMSWSNSGSPNPNDTAQNGVVLEPSASGPANVKTFDGLATASVKTANGLAIASVKTADGLA